MGLLAPWFLAGLAGLSIPVFVHLLRRHTIPPRPFSSLMFFERGKQSSTRHRRLRYLLLFALRAALLLLLVLAFANPFFRSASAGVNGSLLLVVIDNSFSMRAGSRLQDAKQAAIGVLAAKSGSRRAQVATLGAHLDILTEPVQDASTLRAAVEGIQPGDSQGNFGQLARGVRALAQTVPTPIELDLFSDMQKTGMTANFADMVLPANVSLVLHPVPKALAAVPNWTVESVNAPSQVAGPKELDQSPVRAVIVGYATPAATRTVSLIVNGKTVATRKVAIPANGRAAVEFPSLDVPYGFSRCAVKIDSADAFPADDASVFAVERSDPERVLLVHQASDSRSPLYFGDALAAAAHASFVSQSIIAERSTDISPSQYAFVVLSDAVTLPSIFENALLQYVRGGGGVLIAAGTSAAHHARIPVWDESVLGSRDFSGEHGYATIGETDLTHPAMDDAGGEKDVNGGGATPGAAKGVEAAGWSDLKFYYAALVDPAQSRVIVRLADGTPLLLDKQVGEGHVLLFASGFDNLTNDLPLHPVFVSFVDRVARYLSGRERFNGSRVVDSFVQLRTAATQAPTQTKSQATAVEVIDPEGRRPLTLNEAKSIQSYQLTRAGFYQLRFANGKDALIGVNPDRRESNLEPMPKDMLQLWSAGSAEQAGQPAAALADEGKNNPHSLWWYVILLGLVVAVAESALASRYMGTLREEA